MGGRSAFAATGVREERRRAVVIGSGFGGSVTALRLAQAGVDVLMLERGKRWPVGQRGTFPGLTDADHRAVWMKTVPLPGAKKYTGLLERFKGSGIEIIAPAAVGGGSLPYHGMSVRPRADHFARVMPAELDYEEMASVFYPRAEAMLKVGRMPADVLAHARYRSSRQFMEYVKRAGFPEAQPVPMTIDWEQVRRELRGEIPPVISTGNVVLGVNGPGKHSLDTNYQPAAQATGRFELRPQHDVTAISRDASGRWVVEANVITTAGEIVERLRVTTDALFLGAGTMNTSKILLRARDTGAIPDLPDDIGRYWGTNGDVIHTAFLKDNTGTWQGGPANVASLDWDNPEGPVTLLFAPLPLSGEAHMMQLVAIFIPDGHGSLSYDGARDKLNVRWPKSADAKAIGVARRRMAQLTRAAGAVGNFDSTRAGNSTFHQLGGAVIGKVCDAHGRVQGQRGLYVIDGALIPGSTACANPSLTIAALAERNAATVVAQDAGSIF
ncbi:MAG: GMC family oxidoreductase [Solirubrobacteraceae bacterium]|nr:GMC family oxidoreductase [Solirubrobacteraceae bacterium]